MVGEAPGCEVVDISCTGVVALEKMPQALAALRAAKKKIIDAGIAADLEIICGK